jgi:MFS family permease
MVRIARNDFWQRARPARIPSMPLARLVPATHENKIGDLSMTAQTAISSTPSQGSAGARQPRLIQAAILLVTSSLTVLVTAILGPSLPAMQAHFKDVPGADYLVPLTMTAPMLVMAGLSVFVGELADRLGRKRLLVGSTLLYAVVGTMPLYLESLTTIIASRFALGLMESVLMTISTTMIGDYFDGRKRERFMSLQTTVAASSAFILNSLGGAIAEHGWRAPYAVFSASLILAPLMMIFLWEPTTRRSMSAAQFAEDTLSFRPKLLTFICTLAVALGVIFLTVPVHFGYLYGAIGEQSTARIGIGYAINSLGVISGTLLFGWVLSVRFGVALQLGIGMLAAGLGFLLMKAAGDYTALTAGGLINGIGCGILLPTMVTWNMRDLPISRRGMGTGAFQSCLFFGQFINPILIVGLEKEMGGLRAAAIGAEGQLLLVLSVVAIVIGLRRKAQ